MIKYGPYYSAYHQIVTLCDFLGNFELKTLLNSKILQIITVF